MVTKLTYPIPANDIDRVASLRALSILDTAPEARFDQLTKLAQRLFNVPIALLTLLDQDRQWFKSVQGLEERETSRDISFCTHAIMRDDVMVIADTLKNPTFASNPFVTDSPNIRFYAGCPVAAIDGNKLGAFCIIDRVPRQLNPAEMQLLRELSDLAEYELNHAESELVDEFTGLRNRQGLLKLLRSILTYSRRVKQPVSSVVFHLDNLSEISQKHGAAEGDRALIRAASLITQTFRESDAASRVGVDEFCVIFPRCPEKDTEIVLARFEKNVREKEKLLPLPYKLSFSVGVISWDPDNPESIDTAMQRAEQTIDKVGKPRRINRV